MKCFNKQLQVYWYEIVLGKVILMQLSFPLSYFIFLAQFCFWRGSLINKILPCMFLYVFYINDNITTLFSYLCLGC